MSTKKKLLIIGMDGATWDVIEPLCRNGHLPAFSCLVENGVRSQLDSTIPPATFPAWSTFMTGKNPGKHGIFDFTERIHGTYNVRFLNSTYCKSKSLWQILSRSGLRVGVMGVPVTYPPEDINGFMISGFDSPVSKNIDHSFIKPPELYHEIINNVGEYSISDLLENFMNGEQWYYSARRKLSSSLEMKTRAALYLYRREPWDCFMVLFGESDTASHHFWKFYDNLSPRHETTDDLLSNVIPDIYKKLDGVVSEFMENLWDDTTILIVSDHGSGGVSDKAVSINKWLQQEGFLHLNSCPTLLEGSLEFLRRAGLKYLPHRFQEKVFRSRLRYFAQKMESSSRFRSIEWDKTAAFSEDLGHCPSIHVNLKGREPEGTVSGAKEYDRIREKIIEKISQWQDPETGSSIVSSAWKREDVYKGDYVHLAPDIILDFNTDRGYSYFCLPHRCFSSDEVFKRFPKDELSGARLLSMSGSHRQEGVFLCSGDSLSLGGKLSGKTAIQDITPTILSFFGIPVDRDMDGQQLNIFGGGKNHPSGPDVCDEKNSEFVPYTEEQEKKVAARLKSLGYLD